MTENSGRRLLAGRYEVGEYIGQGGMSTVYRGVDTKLGRSVAIKIMKAQLAQDDEFRERFPAVQASTRLFEQDAGCLSGSGCAVTDLFLTLINDHHGADLAALVAEDLNVERIRDGSEQQRVPLRNRLGSTHPKLTQAVILMESSIAEPLTTDEIARQVGVSRRQLERIFKQYLNSVPSQYYLELRLNRARQMLQQTSKSIIQIGLSCGFSSGPHFSSAYRNCFGVTPRDGRNQYRANLAQDRTTTQ